MQFQKDQLVFVPKSKEHGKIVTIDITDDDTVMYYVQLVDSGACAWLEGSSLAEIPKAGKKKVDPPKAAPSRRKPSAKKASSRKKE